MSYVGTNFVDAGQAFMSMGVELSTRPKRFNDRSEAFDEFAAGELNARWFKAVFDSTQYSLNNPVRVYIPEGRYYVGLPSTLTASSEQMADLLVPAHVTLVFGPKATLVPLEYTPERISRQGAMGPGLSATAAAAWLTARRNDLPESERFRVRVEIQGRIEADLDKIFDPFLEDDRDTDGTPSTVVPTRRGGTVFFTRDNLRTVYPEWWGAVPKRGDNGPLTQAEIRRTTVALQSCFDAVLHHRITLARTVGSRQVRPSTEVIFANDYVIDRPIRLGMSLARARVMTDLTYVGDEYPFHSIGVSIRGLCGPAKGRNGAALLQAASDFEPEDPPPSAPDGTVPPLFGDSYSLMIVRTGAPVSIDNVVFDANGAMNAQRCLTIMSFIPSTHHHTLEGCTFRNARYAQLYVGGEVPTDIVNVPGTGDVAHVPGRYFSGGQDLGNMRITRCVGETGGDGGLALPRAPFRGRTTPTMRLWRHGVVYRSEPGLGTEFHGCVFRGRASPMVLALGGRLSFQDCLFDTDTVTGAAEPDDAARLNHIPLRGWNGTDLYLAAGFGEFLWRRGVRPVPTERINAKGRTELVWPTIQPIQQTMLTARNVVSRSRQFLSTHPDIFEVRASNFLSYASVTLLHVRHRSRFDDVRPAIYWGAPRLNNCALVIEGCVFDTPAPADSVRGSVFISPIEPDEVDNPTLSPVFILASRRSAAGPLLTTDRGRVIQNVMLVPE
jgi:hypothetical protein